MYAKIIEAIFLAHYKKGDTKVRFQRDEIPKFAAKLGLDVPKNLGDVVYSFRYRSRFPASISKLCGKNEEWTIHGVKHGEYEFRKGPATSITPQGGLQEIKIPNATPAIVARYALDDEQAVLTKIRYNRLIDLTLGVVAYSLQNHLRTTIEGSIQIEIDELYVGVDKCGRQYVIPVQAKGGSDRIGRAQLEQDIAYCRQAYADLICMPIAAQFMAGGVICVFQLTIDEERVKIVQEKHYKLVAASEISPEDLRALRNLAPAP